MKSALAIVAFSRATKHQGIKALLETALAALDDSGNHLVAAHVDLALAVMDRQSSAPLIDDSVQIRDFG